MKQGCLLAPYLFLIVAEVMNAMVKVEVDLEWYRTLGFQED
jgi:hypothetical protein